MAPKPLWARGTPAWPGYPSSSHVVFRWCRPALRAVPVAPQLAPVLVQIADVVAPIAPVLVQLLAVTVDLLAILLHLVVPACAAVARELATVAFDLTGQRRGCGQRRDEPPRDHPSRQSHGTLLSSVWGLLIDWTPAPAVRLRADPGERAGRPFRSAT